MADDQGPTTNDDFLMRIAYLECFSGISGDMFLGALVDAGVPARVLEETVAALGVGARLEISRVMRSGISATKVDVWVNGEKDLPREEYWERREQHDHQHSHGHHEHSHDDPHEHESEPASSQLPRKHSHSHKHERGLTEIREIISAAAISSPAKNTAIAIFEALGAAEAKIHNISIESVHFHEVGAVDALVDIVCAAVGAEALG
ncbi:MAG: nickel insertion protein, partial [Candidatus Sulfotelmatobacter sp.]